MRRTASHVLTASIKDIMTEGTIDIRASSAQAIKVFTRADVPARYSQRKYQSPSYQTEESRHGSIKPKLPSCRL